MIIFLFFSLALTSYLTLQRREGYALERKAYQLSEVAEMIGVSYRTLYNWAQRGDIPSVRVAGRHLVPAAELDRMLASKPDNKEV